MVIVWHLTAILISLFCLFILHIDSTMSLIFHGLFIFLKCFLMSSLTEEGL